MANKALIGVAAGGVLLYLWARSRQQGEEDAGFGGGGGGLGGAGEYAGNPYDSDGDGVPDTPVGPTQPGGQDGYGDADGDGIPDPWDYHFGEGAYPPEAGADGTGTGDPRTTDTDDDGVPDQWDYLYGQGDGTDPGPEPDYPEPGFFDTGLGTIVGFTVAGAIPTAAAAGYRALKSTRAPLEFIDETPLIRNTQRAIASRGGTSRVVQIADDLVSPAGRVAQQTIGKTSQTALRIAQATPDGLSRIAATGTPKAAAVVNQAGKLTASTVRAASAASKPATVATELAAGAARFAQATRGFTARAAPVVGRAGVVVDVAVGGYTAARNLWDTGAAVGHAISGDREAAQRASAQAVERGTGFLSLGAADYNPNSGEVRIFNQRFTPDAPNSFGEAGRNLRTNLGNVGRNLRRGGRDGNRWTIWK